MIENKIYRVKQESTISKINLTLKKEQELEVVRDVVYMGGFMVQTSLQSSILEWVKANPSLLTEITR